MAELKEGQPMFEVELMQALGKLTLEYCVAVEQSLNFDSAYASA
jgi:hypothetical protein